MMEIDPFLENEINKKDIKRIKEWRRLTNSNGKSEAYMSYNSVSYRANYGKITASYQGVDIEGFSSTRKDSSGGGDRTPTFGL